MHEQIENTNQHFSKKPNQSDAPKPIGVHIPTTLEAQATRTISQRGNLDAGAPIKTFDIDDPLRTSSFSSGFPFFDSIGKEHSTIMYFTKTANNTWQYNLVGNASEFVVLSTAISSDGNSSLLATGTLRFTTGGLLDLESSATYYNAFLPTGITFTNGAATILSANLTFNFGTSITGEWGSGDDGMHQQGGPSVLLTFSQDGYTTGVLSGVSMDPVDGQVLGRFSNDQVSVLGQVKPTIFALPDTKDDKPRRRASKHHRHNNQNINSNPILAEQSGVWTVGQLGTWHVKIDGNESNPMPIVDMTSTKHSPWAKTQRFDIQEGQTKSNSLRLVTPTSQRLVIEHISLESTVETTIRAKKDPKIAADIQVMLNNQPVTHHLGVSETLVTRQDSTQRIKHVLSKPFRIYADPDSLITLNVERNYFNHPQSGTISLSGFLESLF